MKNEIKILFDEWKQYMYNNMDEIMDELKEGIDVNNFINEIEHGEFEFVYNDMLRDHGLDHIRMWIFDEFDRQFMYHNCQQFYDNLIKHGCECDLENDNFNISDKIWDKIDENGKKWTQQNNKTSYGVIWDYWYDLDTCIRETVSEEFLEGVRNK